MQGTTEIRDGKSRLSGWWYLLLLVPLAVYMKGLAPSVVLGDTGDFQTAGWIWGVAHPPGYPLYTILVGIFERLPIPPIWLRVDEFSLPAWRANLLSALLATGAVAALFALVNRLTGRTWAALISAAALAFSRIFWWHAEIAENDALSSLFILLLLLVTVRWAQERRARDPWLLALLIGLALSHHQAIVLFIPAILVYLALRKALGFSAKQWAGLVLVFILGLTPFLYLPLVRYKSVNGPVVFASERSGGIPWSEDSGVRYSDKTSLKYFIDYVGRSIYSEERKYTHTEEALGEDRTTTSDVFHFYVDLVHRDYGIPLVIVGLLGLLLGFRNASPRKRDSESMHNWIFAALAYGVCFLVLHFYRSGDILRAPMYNLAAAGPGLMLPLEVSFAVLIGLGIGAILTGLESAKIGVRAANVAILILGIIAVALSAAGNFGYCDKSRNTLAHEYALNVFDSCPPDAVLVAGGDEIYALMYMHTVYPDPSDGSPGYRRDVRLTAWSAELENLSELSDVSGAMAGAIARLSREHPGTGIETTFFNSRFLEEPALASYTLARRGLLFSFVPPEMTASLAEVDNELKERYGIALYDPGLPDAYRWGYWERGDVLRHEYRSATEWSLWPPEEEVQWRIGEMLLFYGTEALLSGDTENAREYFSRLTQVEPHNREAREILGSLTEGR